MGTVSSGQGRREEEEGAGSRLKNGYQPIWEKLVMKVVRSGQPVAAAVKQLAGGGSRGRSHGQRIVF